MLSMEEIRNMSLEERKAEMLDAISDAVREMVKRIAMLKAISYRENDIAPEDFDTVFNRELSKAWEKVKDKQSHELAAMALLDMLSKGLDPDELLGGE